MRRFGKVLRCGVAVSCLAGFTVPMAACSETCTDSDSNHGVSVSVVDADGAVIPFALVTVSFEGGEIAPCAREGAGQWECDNAVGDYYVYVASPGFNPEEFMKTVVDDTCYNEGEQVTVSLPDVCDDYAGPAVSAEVTVPEATAVTWTPESGLPQDCALADGIWACGSDYVGFMTIDATGATGSAHQMVNVPMNGCNAVTQAVTLAMAPAE